MSVLSVLETYFQEIGKKHVKSKLTSAISRWVAPSWGHSYPENALRLSSDEKRRLLNFLDTVPESNIKDINNIFDSNTKDIKSDCIYSYRSEVKKFYNWSYEKRYFYKKKPFKEKLICPKDKSKWSSYKGLKKYGRQKPYTLMARHGGGNSNKRTLIYENDYINDKLQKDLNEYQRFRVINDVREPTIKKEVAEFKRFLGWLHRFQGIPLENLRLSSLIFNYPLTTTIKKEKTLENFNRVKNILRQEAIEKAVKNIELIQQYFDFLRESSVSKSSQTIYTEALISLAKFTFHKELNKDDEFIDYDDLPIIKRLHRLRKHIKASKEPVIPYSKKIVEWKEVLEILESLRLKSLAEYYDCKQRGGSNRIPKSASYRNLQRFLSLAFCVIIPTDRSRTYYELEVGRTFKFGYFTNERFKSLDWSEKDDKGYWFIHLESDDYKTGKVYGEYWSLPIENVEFKDGTKFYDYIYKWLKEGRNYGKKCEHNCFFRGFDKHQKLDNGSWYARIKSIFLNYTGIPVSPRSLRHMYVTQERRIGATPQELQASAMARHHSTEMAEKVYNEQTQQELLAPYQNLNKRMLGNLVK